jgi:predicted GNAT family acetyltransferase
MASLYSQYNSECRNKQTIENDNGFLVYSIDHGILYIEDYFVTPEHRGTGLLEDMASFAIEIGKSKGCKQLLGSVDIQTKDSTVCVEKLIKYGMKIYSLKGNVIYFMKDI